MLGPKVPLLGKRYFVVFVLRLRNVKEAKECMYEGLRSFEEEANDPKGS